MTVVMLQKKGHIQRQMDNIILNHQIFSIENIGSAQFGTKLFDEFI